jgi:hypothetical protein
MFNELSKQEQPPQRGTVHLDFEHTFPHIFWTSGWDVGGFRYKVLSVRHEPGGGFEIVLLHEARNGGKTELQRWSVPADKFDASADMIQMLEQKLAVSFDRVDMSAVRTVEEFEARSKEIGWLVSLSSSLTRRWNQRPLRREISIEI